MYVKTQKYIKASFIEMAVKLLLSLQGRWLFDNVNLKQP